MFQILRLCISLTIDYAKSQKYRIQSTLEILKYRVKGQTWLCQETPKQDFCKINFFIKPLVGGALCGLSQKSTPQESYEKLAIDICLCIMIIWNSTQQYPKNKAKVFCPDFCQRTSEYINSLQNFHCATREIALNNWKVKNMKNQLIINSAPNQFAPIFSILICFAY